jgi:hypothetical protein
MKVTATKDLTVAEIENLTTKELRDLYVERIEDWLIKPMDILSQHDHTGWAVLQLFLTLEDLLGGAVRFPVIYERVVLLDEALVVDGSFENDIAATFEEGGDIELVKVNPLKLPALARKCVKSIRDLGDLAPIDLDDFKAMLMKKAERADKSDEA